MHNKKYLHKRRQHLRNNATSAEAFMWKFLSNRKLEGRKFRRQHSIANYIVDFYCPAERLIIELDGNVHMNQTQAARDRRRDHFFKKMDYRVLRFENRMVFDNLSSVLREIEDCFRN